MCMSLYKVFCQACCYARSHKKNTHYIDLPVMKKMNSTKKQSLIKLAAKSGAVSISVQLSKSHDETIVPCS